MKAIIKKYLEELCTKDEYLAGLYKEECLDGCIDYITDLAKKKCSKDENCVAIEDATVFKWARDYFTEGHAATDMDKKAQQKAASAKFEEEQKEREARWAQEKKEREEKTFLDNLHKDGQLSIFDLGA